MNARTETTTKHHILAGRRNEDGVPCAQEIFFPTKKLCPDRVITQPRKSVVTCFQSHTERRPTHFGQRKVMADFMSFWIGKRRKHDRCEKASRSLATETRAEWKMSLFIVSMIKSAKTLTECKRKGKTNNSVGIMTWALTESSGKVLSKAYQAPPMLTWSARSKKLQRDE